MLLLPCPLHLTLFFEKRILFLPYFFTFWPKRENSGELVFKIIKPFRPLLFYNTQSFNSVDRRIASNNQPYVEVCVGFKWKLAYMWSASKVALNVGCTWMRIGIASAMDLSCVEVTRWIRHLYLCHGWRGIENASADRIRISVAFGALASPDRLSSMWRWFCFMWR